MTTREIVLSKPFGGHEAGAVLIVLSPAYASIEDQPTVDAARAAWLVAEGFAVGSQAPPDTKKARRKKGAANADA